jgi:hypothetical protein
MQLKALDIPNRIETLRKALSPKGPFDVKDIPDKTRILVKTFWPLVLTTNYDDCILAAAFDGKFRYRVCGRSLEDCHSILRSLDEPQAPAVWYLQGFIGGQFNQSQNFGLPIASAGQLADQMVLGHQQYQHVIHGEQHFRRAFSEVFRRRSFIFLGSGIKEEYLVSLFSEIVHHFGIGSYPHFALLPKDDQKDIDGQFYQTRLGIVPVWIEDHREAEAILEELAELTSNPLLAASPSSHTTCRPISFVYSLSCVKQARPVNICVNHEALHFEADSKDRVAYVLSVGRNDASNSPIFGSMAERFLAGNIRNHRKGPFQDWKAIDKKRSYLFQCADAEDVFGLAARDRNTDFPIGDQRDLRCIPEAVASALQHIDQKFFSRVKLGGIASGQGSTIAPIHSFVQVLRGIKDACTDGLQNLQTIQLCLVDPSVWGNVISEKVWIPELLSSDTLNYKIVIEDAEHRRFRMNVCMTERRPTWKHVIEVAGLPLARWKLRLYPPVSQKQLSQGEVLECPALPSIALVLESDLAKSE